MKNPNYCPGVCSVVVTYNPDLDTLRQALFAAGNQVSDVFIVDNASANFREDWYTEIQDRIEANLHVLPQQKNLGLGGAHNIGIQAAIAQGAQFVLLLDQDSQIDPDMVSKLVSVYRLLDGQNIQVAAIGPRYRDEKNGQLSGFVKIGFFRFTHCDCTTEDEPVDIDFLVSSGSLIPVSVLEQVGLMDESLFIDHVDTEWCFRAKAQGFKVYGACNAAMTHTLGEQRKEVWFLRKRVVPFHKPFRYYYMFRNSVLLYRRSYMPWRWKYIDIIRCLKLIVFFSWVSDERRAIIKMMFLGLIDGLKGISGRRNIV